MEQNRNNQNRSQMRVVIVGHVDHGKSTLIGRLLHDTDSLPEGKLEELKDICAKRGTDALEWSFVLDAFQAERDQAVTIDTTQIRFSTQKRDYVIIDAPGHREFLKNMISGAAAADAAILVVDAKEGLQEQTRRHAYLLSLLGIKQIAVAVNKMDLVDYDQARFDAVAKDIKDYLGSIGVAPSCILPISARNGVMIVERSDNLDWYKGRGLIEALDHFEEARAQTKLPLRFMVQDVYRVKERRILVGRVESGTLTVGDKLTFSPGEETATVKSIEVWPEDPARVKAQAGDVIGITLDQRLFVERGAIGAHEDNLPKLSNVFQSNLFWLSQKPLKVGDSYTLRYGTAQIPVTVQSIDSVIETHDLSQQGNPDNVARNAVAKVTLRASRLMALDSHADIEQMGRMVLYDGYDLAGGGVITTEGYPDQRAHAPKSQNIYEVSHLLEKQSRAKLKGHKGGVFWFTGLSGAGKSTLAMQVEKALHEKGYHTYVLDGDNVRHGLNADLGFSPEDRAENIRRIGEVAALMADAGLIVITAFISPYRADRQRARQAAAPNFHEVYAYADLATCEARDPKGLYKKARGGEIKEFTGIDAPYEAPENPELTVNTQKNDIQTCVDQVLSYMAAHTHLNQNDVSEERTKERFIAL